MRRFLLILCLWPWVALGALPETNGVDAPASVCGATDGTVNGVAGSAAGCTTLQISETATSNNGINNAVAARQYMATKFTTVGAYTVCAADLYQLRTGSPSMNIRACIYSHNASDYPDTSLGCSDWVAAASIATSETAIAYANLNVALSATTIYWVVMESSAVQDSSNHITWRSTGSETLSPTRMMNDADGTGAWTLISANDAFLFRTFSE